MKGLSEGSLVCDQWILKLRNNSEEMKHILDPLQSGFLDCESSTVFTLPHAGRQCWELPGPPLA